MYVHILCRKIKRTHVLCWKKRKEMFNLLTTFYPQKSCFVHFLFSLPAFFLLYRIIPSCSSVFVCDGLGLFPYFLEDLEPEECGEINGMDTIYFVTTFWSLDSGYYSQSLFNAICVLLLLVYVNMTF